MLNSYITSYICQLYDVFLPLLVLFLLSITSRRMFLHSLQPLDKRKLINPNSISICLMNTSLIAYIYFIVYTCYFMSSSVYSLKPEHYPISSTWRSAGTLWLLSKWWFKTKSTWQIHTRGDMWIYLVKYYKKSYSVGKRGQHIGFRGSEKLLKSCFFFLWIQTICVCVCFLEKKVHTLNHSLQSIYDPKRIDNYMSGD